MSGIQWSQEQTMLFLETLQAEPFIWDPSEKSHKDKKKVNDAWDHGTDSIEEETTNASEDVPIASPTPKEPEPRKNKHTIRRRDNPPELQVASRQMTEAFNNLNKVINNPSKDDYDECDVFGKLIAKKLKRLPEHERDNIMFDIHALFRKSPNKRSPSGESFCTS
ncbi:uncharacterized protein LOC123701174 [Colias croceus]|uniref:uncharacterized protein LOC123701174 n=1 Tax=Colias crocea TaxID=72248 RepID=UPI001E27DBFA|nr:uncharacterized protein LOC123701174 [Colias croceus]